MNIEECQILYIEDDNDMILGLEDFFNNEKGLCVKYIRRYDDVRKTLRKIQPRLIIVDDDLNGRSRYEEIAFDIKHFLASSGKTFVYIGCTSEKVDLKSLKSMYKKVGYADFLANTGTLKDLEKMYNLIIKIITKL